VKQLCLQDVGQVEPLGQQRSDGRLAHQASAAHQDHERDPPAGERSHHAEASDVRPTVVTRAHQREERCLHLVLSEVESLRVYQLLLQLERQPDGVAVRHLSDRKRPADEEP